MVLNLPIVSRVERKTKMVRPSQVVNMRLIFCVPIYNYIIPQRALRHQTPIQALKKWQQERPKWFVNTVYDQAGLDMS
jgi:hypothetical protein